MSKFVTNTGTKIVLATGVTIKSVNQASDLVLKDQAKINERIDDISIAYAAHLIEQEQFRDMKKGDITLVKAWIENLFAVAPSQAKAIVTWYKDLFGFDMTVVYKDDDNKELGYECLMTMVKDRNFEKIRDGLFDKMRTAMEKGICQDTEKYFKPKPRKRNTGKGSGENSNVITKTEGEVALHESGISDFVTAHKDDVPKEFLDKMKELLELYVEHPNKAQAGDVIDGALNKYRNAIQAAAGKVAGQALKKAS